MHPGTEPAPLKRDTHKAQADRIALHSEQHPGQFFTCAELAAACECGGASKVLSVMVKELGYEVAKDWHSVTCASGTRTRRVRVYRVIRRPIRAQQDLFRTP
jgi:hypothetical protein